MANKQIKKKLLFCFCIMFNCFYFVHVLYLNQYNSFYPFFNNISDIREILRRVSPYIVRQWKEVCRELGVPETELLEIETTSYSKKVSTLAYRGLCLWFEQMGKLATKEKLISVLKKNGLRRAEGK